MYLLLTLFFLLVFTVDVHAISLRARGDFQSLREENAIVDFYKLERVENDSQLEKLVNDGLLLPIPEETRWFKIDTKEIAEHYRYARPWVLDFLYYISEKYFKKFGKKLRLTSLTRTIEHQEDLVKRKKSIATCTIPGRCSPHVTGTSLDISMLGMLFEEYKWLLDELTALYLKERKIHAIDEGYRVGRNHFHIVVAPSYPESSPIIQPPENIVIIKKQQNQQQKKVQPPPKKKPRKGVLRIVFVYRIFFLSLFFLLR